MTNLSRRDLFLGMASAALAAVVAPFMPRPELTGVVRDTWVEGGALQFADVTAMVEDANNTPYGESASLLVEGPDIEYRLVSREPGSIICRTGDRHDWPAALEWD